MVKFFVLANYAISRFVILSADSVIFSETVSVFFDLDCRNGFCFLFGGLRKSFCGGHLSLFFLVGP